MADPNALIERAAAVYPSLRNKRVLVTGGATSIGAAIVEAFAAQGAVVVFLDIAAADGASLQSQFGEGSEVRFIECDLRDIARLRASIADAEREFGSFDVLVNNAANDDRHKVDAISADYWDERMATNLRHQFFCAQAVARGMAERGGGSIINLGSISWHLALPDLVVYQTAKAGVEGLTRALARDLGGDGIRVNCVVPGGVRTPRQMALWHDASEEARMLDRQCLKKRVVPEDVAAMVLFLASDDAAMCTGSTFFVDGGWR